MKSLVSRLSLITMTLVMVGCAIEPWVQPYEREAIADSIMSFDRDPVANGYLHHVYDAREAARGGDGGAGGGCGCN